MEHIQPCHEELMSLQIILNKLNEVNECCDDMKDCCDTLSTGDVIRVILIKDPSGTKHRAYMTDDGSTPLQVPFVDGDPIETYLNTHLMKRIFLNGTDLFELYLNGDIVFRKILELELPQYTSEINLKDFIDANNPENLVVVEVTNNLTQPGIVTGSLCGMEVELINNGEIQGISSGGDALVIDSVCPMKLTNNGWIRGAGGDGGDGAGFNAGSIPSHIGVWEPRESYDDPRHSCTYDACICQMVCVSGYQAGKTPPTWASPSQGGYHNYTNRFWKEGQNHNYSGAWVMSGGPVNQEYWNVMNRTVNHAPIWGDQGPCHYNTSGVWCKHRSGTKLYIAVRKAVSVSGGTAGNGGAGQGFRVATDAGWSRGTDGYYSGPSAGFTLTLGKHMNEGKNISLPSAGSLVGEDGGHGGAWATGGTQSENGTNPGKSPGKAIVGFVNLTGDSDTGSVNGAIV